MRAYTYYMNYYRVLVSSPQFHGHEPLTYGSDQQLKLGQVVLVPLRQKLVAGVIIDNVRRPTFSVKPIERPVVDEPLPTALIELVHWLQRYYPAPLGAIAQLLVPASVVRKRPHTAVDNLPTPPEKPAPLPVLSQQQAAALKTIAQGKQRSFLLHGDTGTGKTRLYLELAHQTLNQGKSVLMLTPEIGLTPQLEERVRQSLSAPVVVIHSQLSPAERRTVWLQIISAQQPLVVIGPRSALFAPLANIGLIVVDEAHDQAYKQESAPRYQALRVASQLAHLHRATIIFGTATPAVTEYALAEAKNIPVLRLTERPAGQHTTKEIRVIDLKDRQQFTRHPYLSQPLIAATEKALQQKQQVLLLLNRRGSARLVVCQQCGWQAICPNCDVSLTYHADQHRLRCHTCGFSSAAPTGCPTCQSPDVIYRGIGTKSLAETLPKLFPGARIKRFDTDNLKAERLEQHYQAISQGQIDILVGTQMLAKGLDLPQLTVVGVVTADTNLFFPDYTAEEQTYQLLTQVIGRVGRGHRSGRVFIQTYNPDSQAIVTATQQSWDNFYQDQLQQRQAYGFPPFYHCLKLSCLRATSAAAQTAAQKLRLQLLAAEQRIEVVGPAPSFYEKIGGKYQWQIIVKAKERQELLKLLPLLPANWTVDLDPLNLL